MSQEVRPSSPAVGPLFLIGGVVAIILVALAGRYGYHRDELYFLAAGDHLAWGYPDQGPLTPAIAALADGVMPGSLTALRVPSAVMTAATVVLAGLTARELGGSRRAQVLAALCVSVAGVVLAVGHLLSTTTFDLLAWTAVIFLAVRAVRTGNDRLWLVAGLILGVALLNKPLIAFLVAGLIGGVLIAGPRRVLRSPWAWGGAVLALALWAPWLVWQAGQGWPQFEVARSIAEGGSVSSQSRLMFLPFQVLLAGPLLAPIWVAGLVGIFRSRGLRPYRFVGWVWILLAAAFLVLGGKPYYLAGMLPVLLASGSVLADSWLERGASGLRWAVLVGALVLSAIPSVLIGLPVLPERSLAPVMAVNPDVGETIGWPELMAEIADIRQREALPQNTVILTSNYGEAGALARFGAELGLPHAYSGHNGFWHWGQPPAGSRPVLLIGFEDRAAVGRWFNDCKVLARISNPAQVDNQEWGDPIQVCAAPARPWAELWPSLRQLG